MNEDFAQELLNASRTPLSGGDINEVYRVEDKQGKVYVVKENHANDFPKMFEKEEKGLALLQANSSFRIPETSGVFYVEEKQFLFMEYITEGRPTQDTARLLGTHLAEMHRSTQSHFGLSYDNYIGSLVQSNSAHDEWISFLINERFIPLIKRSVDHDILPVSEAKKFEAFFPLCHDFWPEEKSALLHGDLWSGNKMVDASGNTVLIDPAVYYGHREMEIGMMHLFGGFSEDVFQQYNEDFPLEKGWEARISYNQLYPLLVHLNLFGMSYWGRIAEIIKEF